MQLVCNLTPSPRPLPQTGGEGKFERKSSAIKRSSFALLISLLLVLTTSSGFAQNSSASGSDVLQGNPKKTHDSKGRLLYKPGELLVRFKKGTTEEQIESLHHGKGNRTIGKNERMRLHRVKLKEGVTEEEAIKHYAASPLVELVERHALRYPNKVPNDPYLNDQWALQNISLPKAWDLAQECPEVIIAVVDTGVDYAHPDLSDNIWVNTAELNGTAGVDDDGNGFIDDLYGWDFADGDAVPLDVFRHGTHVAGIIGAKGNNADGVAGVCWTAKIMVLKVQADEAEEMDDLAVINALQYAADQGARIVNCSFGGDAYSQAEYDAFAELETAGILTVCAAGNSSRNIDASGSQLYPASYGFNNILVVAASNQASALASFSNYGLTSVDIMAPGVSIKSTVPGAYEARDGTSMAAPYVSGVAGLILSKKPQMTYTAVKSTIMNKVDLVPSVAGKIVSGGKVNALAALCSTNILPADVTFDHQISLADAVLSFQILSGFAQPVCSPANAPSLDVNGDGKIGIEEVIYLLQEIGGIR
jgi:subtilisin family serine protease